MSWADATDLIETGWYFTAFWAFLLKPSFRRAKLDQFRRASRSARARQLLDAALATVIGLGLPGLIVWLIVT